MQITATASVNDKTINNKYVSMYNLAKGCVVSTILTNTHVGLCISALSEGRVVRGGSMEHGRTPPPFISFKTICRKGVKKYSHTRSEIFTYTFRNVSEHLKVQHYPGPLSGPDPHAVKASPSQFRTFRTPPLCKMLDVYITIITKIWINVPSHVRFMGIIHF